MNIIIDQEWLDNNRKEWGGYLLDQDDATYTLETDVTTPRSAFAVGGENITFDIQDHTISFANRTMQRIWNYAFGSKWQRRGRGWELPEGSHIQFDCDYLKRECQVGKSAFVIPEMSPGKEYVLKHTGDKVLKAGETYALSWWDDRPRSTVDLEVTIGGLSPATPYRKDKPGTTSWAIFMPEEDVTGPIEFTMKLKEGKEEAHFRMDNVKLNYSRCHGITARGSAVHWNNDSPDIPIKKEYNRTMEGFTLKGSKGRIVEGRYGFGGCCVNLRASNNCRIEGNIYMSLHRRSINDLQGCCIHAMYASNLRISPKVRTNNRAISTTSRQGFGGYSIFSPAMRGGDNFFGLNSIGSNQGTIACSLDKKTEGGSMVISGKGKTQVRFTNGFFVMVNEGHPSSSTIVQDLDISNTGANDGSRGIHWDGHPEASGYNSINNCHIVTKELPLNQEYITKENYPLGGCYGIQVESCANNLIIQDNYVEINGDSESAVYRLQGNDSEPLKVTTINNKFVSLCEDPPTQKRRASVFKPGKVDGDNLGAHKNNHIIFNDCLVEFMYGNTGDILFEDTTIEYRDEGSKHESAYQIAYHGCGTIEFRNTTFVGSGTWERLTKEVDPGPNLNHIGSDVIVKFTDASGVPIYILHVDAETKTTTHWSSGAPL
jgi:hypothetical protein